VSVVGVQTAPIGGFFELALLDIPTLADSIWHAWSGDGCPVITAWTARAALSQLIVQKHPGRIWLPAYSCGELAAVAPKTAVRFYRLDEMLSPDLRFLRQHVKAGDLVLAINYFGWPPSGDFVNFVSGMNDVIWVEDRAHCLWTEKAPWAPWVLYSPRKLVGVSDGGILISRDDAVVDHAVLSEGDACLALPELTRFEDTHAANNQNWYAAFRTREAQFSAKPLRLSRLTAALLQRIPVRPLVEARQRNFNFLAEQLAPYRAWEQETAGCAPFGLVIRANDAAELVGALAAERLFCARHWVDLAADAAGFPHEHALARSLVTLPCDHRYSTANLTRLVEAVCRLLGDPRHHRTRAVSTSSFEASNDRNDRKQA
jgi:hypothetical protein